MRISDWSSDVCSSDLSGPARIEAYEMDLKGAAAPRRLVLNAQKPDYGDMEQIRLPLSISDVTDARSSEKLKDDMLREKAILLQELQQDRTSTRLNSSH